MLNIDKKKIIIKNYCNNNNDTGSTQMQIIFLSFRINTIKNHLIKNFKDKANFLGYLNLLNKRKKLLLYLKKKKNKIYNKIISDLNIIY